MSCQQGRQVDTSISLKRLYNILHRYVYIALIQYTLYVQYDQFIFPSKLGEDLAEAGNKSRQDHQMFPF
jgi:hypothetical protein